MKTTRKQLIGYAIALIKEIAKTGKHITIDYKNSRINVWFFFKDNEAELISLFNHSLLKVNKQKFKDCILKIRGIKL